MYTQYWSDGQVEVETAAEYWISLKKYWAKTNILIFVQNFGPMRFLYEITFLKSPIYTLFEAATHIFSQFWEVR